jgi:hypothetical protein
MVRRELMMMYFLDLEKIGIIKCKRSLDAVVTNNKRANANVTPEHACNNPNARQKYSRRWFKIVDIREKSSSGDVMVMLLSSDLMGI